MQRNLRLFIYGNEACRDRRPTLPEDAEYYYIEDITVKDGVSCYGELLKVIQGYDDEDVAEYMEEEDMPSSIDEAIDMFDSSQDYGDGSPILYAVYDLTNKEWLVGDENSKLEWLLEYCNEEDYDEAGYDLDELAQMDIN